MNAFKCWYWIKIASSVVALACFAYLGAVTTHTIWLNFKPQQPVAAATGPGAMQNKNNASVAAASPSLFTRLSAFFQGDLSGASAACAALFFLALARFFYMKAVLGAQLALLTNRSHSDAAQILPPDDPVVEFATKVRQNDRKSALEKLDLRMTAHYDLHPYVSRMVCLGLYGTLIGLWLGFVHTLGPEFVGEGGLQNALRQAVIVVATGALSSIAGIGIGQLIVEPMADHIDQEVVRVIDSASDY